jgi:hypothetical protein
MNPCPGLEEDSFALQVSFNRSLLLFLSCALLACWSHRVHNYSDAELQRRRITESRQGVRLAQERLRQIELDIDDASRALRRARTQVQLAKEELLELEDRHWALLALYDVNAAGDYVSEALRELGEIDPAARLGSAMGASSIAVPEAAVSALGSTIDTSMPTTRISEAPPPTYGSPLFGKNNGNAQSTANTAWDSNTDDGSDS